MVRIHSDERNNDLATNCMAFSVDSSTEQQAEEKPWLEMRRFDCWIVTSGKENSIRLPGLMWRAQETSRSQQ